MVERFISIDGGEKEVKLARFGLIPQEALEEVAKVYGYGALKYSDHNWRKGYPWTLSLDALGRHISSFTKGEEIDPESGLPHLAHATFHLLTLLTWSKDRETYSKYDNRWIGGGKQLEKEV